MGKLKPTTPRQLRTLMRKHFWLWGVTGKWFFGQDVLRERLLEPKTLAHMVWKLGGYDPGYMIYRQVEKGVYEVENLTHFLYSGERRPKTEFPVASILFDKQALFLVAFRISKDTEYQRQITLYKLPRGRRLQKLCDDAMKLRANS